MLQVDRRKIVIARANQGMSIVELSERAGVSRQNISGIESGKQNPRLDTLGKLAKALNKSVEEFLLN